MRVAALLVSRNRPDLVEAMATQLRARVTLPCDLYVVECGTQLQKLTPYTSVWYRDEGRRGEAYAHNLGLQQAKLQGPYNYYWVLTNELIFQGTDDPAQTLVGTLEREVRMAICSQTDFDGGYPASAPLPGRDWHAVTTCDYLGFMMKATALDECGFLNPQFKYREGAIHELAYKLYAQGWFVAYSDRTSYQHAEPWEHGAAANPVSRLLYEQNAKRFAFDYYRSRYGDDWDEKFWTVAAPFHPSFNSFTRDKRVWANAFTATELAASHQSHAGLSALMSHDPLFRLLGNKLIGTQGLFGNDLGALSSVATADQRAQAPRDWQTADVERLMAAVLEIQQKLSGRRPANDSAHPGGEGPTYA